MSKYSAITCAAVVAIGIFVQSSVAAPKTEQTEVVGPYRFELEVLPPEPFYTKSQVESEQIKKGMLIVRGASPVQPDSSARPNHHLVVHLFDKVTGKAITGAQVKMEYRPVTSGGEHAGSVSQVPVTEMRVIGQGPSTTHYGNNVSLNPGTYEVTIQANGTTAKFTIKV